MLCRNCTCGSLRSRPCGLDTPRRCSDDFLQVGHIPFVEGLSRPRQRYGLGDEVRLGLDLALAGDINQEPFAGHTESLHPCREPVRVGAWPVAEAGEEQRAHDDLFRKLSPRPVAETTICVKCSAWALDVDLRPYHRSSSASESDVVLLGYSMEVGTLMFYVQISASRSTRTMDPRGGE